MPNLLLTTKASPVTSDGGYAHQLTRRQKVNTVNSFTFNNALLKSVKDYGNVVKGIVQSRQTEYTPDGQIRSRFIASRQVTITDASIITQLRPLIADNAEFVVNLQAISQPQFVRARAKPSGMTTKSSHH